MNRWIILLWNLLIAAQGLIFLAHPIKAYFLTPRIPVLLDLGTRPWTAWRIVAELLVAVSFVYSAWLFIEMAPWTESLAYAVFLIGLFVYSTYESLQPLCLRGDGMRVLAKFLWTRTSRFLPWSEIRRYEWVDMTTLIVNTGWNQITCLIPEEHVLAVKSMIEERVAVEVDGEIQR